VGLDLGKDVVVLIHTYNRGEVSNPLGVSLETQRPQSMFMEKFTSSF
jgi:hypothetical protein